MIDPVVPRGEDSWDGTINTDYEWIDRVDGTLLQKRLQGVTTKYHDFVEVSPICVIERETGLLEHVSGFASTCYCKPENQSELERMILARFIQLIESGAYDE